MKRFALLVAAVLAALDSAPAVAQPRGRAQAGSPSPAPAVAADSDDSDTSSDDGPEAKGAALFKLDDIIEVAVRLSPDLARARAQREIARGQADGARKDQAWYLSAAVDVDKNAPGNNTDVPLATLDETKITGSVGLGRKLPIGGSLALEFGVLNDTRELNVTGDVLPQAQQQQTNCGQAVDVFCNTQFSAKLTFTQPLSRGFGSDVALAPERKADLSAAQATVKAQLAAEQMLRDLIVAYWELAYSAYVVDVRAESLDRARKQDQLTRQELRAGTLSQNSLDEVSFAIVTRQDELLTAKLDFEEKSLDLRRKAGLEITRRDIVVRPADTLELDNREWNVDDILAKSHQINRELASITLDKKLADVDVDLAHDQTKPQIDLNLSGAVLGTGDTGGIALSGLASGDAMGYQVTAGLKFSFELSGASKAAHAAALAKRHSVEIERVAKERELDAGVVSAVKKLISGRTRVALEDKAITIAEENIKAERANFLAGRSSNYQVMNRQNQLAEAQLRRGRAVADYLTSVAKLQYDSGTLLDTYRIHIRVPAGRDQ